MALSILRVRQMRDLWEPLRSELFSGSRIKVLRHPPGDAPVPDASHGGGCRVNKKHCKQVKAIGLVVIVGHAKRKYHDPTAINGEGMPRVAPTATGKP